MDGQPSLRCCLLSLKLQLLWRNRKSSSSSSDPLCRRKRSRAQAAQKAPLHALPVAHLGSSGPSCLWQQHYCSSPLSPLQPPWWHHRLQPSHRALVTVPRLCRDTAAVFRVCHEHFNPQQPRTPNCRAVLGDCSSRTAWVTVVFSIHSMQCSQHERAQRSGYPISSVLSEKKRVQKATKFPCCIFPLPICNCNWRFPFPAPGCLQTDRFPGYLPRAEPFWLWSWIKGPQREALRV